MKAGLISAAGNASTSLPFDVIIMTAVLTTSSTVANRSLAIAGAAVTGVLVTASQTNIDLLASIPPTTGTSGTKQVAVPANSTIAVTNGVAGDTINFTYLALP